MVAQSLGYSSESAFSHAFKRETGMSPKAWRLTELSMGRAQLCQGIL